MKWIERAWPRQYECRRLHLVSWRFMSFQIGFPWSAGPEFKSRRSDRLKRAVPVWAVSAFRIPLVIPRV